MKKLLILFVILFVITLFEIGYYLLNLSKTDNNGVINTQRPLEVEVKEPLIEDNLIAYLKSRTKNSAQKITLIEEVDGFIKYIVYEKPDQMTVDIADAQGNKVFNFIFPVPLEVKNDTQHKILLDKNGELTPLTDIKEIKVGRRIRKTSNIDMTDRSKNTSELIVYEN